VCSEDVMNCVNLKLNYSQNISYKVDAICTEKIAGVVVGR
jgi:hypothetical protein